MRDDREQEFSAAAAKIQEILRTIGTVIVGHESIIERLLMGLIGQGHILIEGLPGLAKTSSVKAISECSDLAIARIQFTPDLLPADVLGTQMYDPRQGEFRIKKGPIFTNLLIADEINRAPAKVQSALLEAMQEGQVTLGEQSYPLPRPFLVMATQNPIEQEGTYPLPEAQMDRFLFKLKVDYTSIEQEMEIVRRMVNGHPISMPQVLSTIELLHLQALSHQVHVAEAVRKYIVHLVFATRRPSEFGLSRMQPFIQVGASPRASINLERAARLNALFQGRNYVVPQDVKEVGMDVLRHRILPTYEAEAENVTTDAIVKEIFSQVTLP